MTLRWPSRIAAFSLWTLAAGSATFWFLKTSGVAEAPITAGVISAEMPAVDLRNLTLALGPGPSTNDIPTAGAPQVLAADPAARLRLLGVVAASRTSGGVALISIEGQIPRPYRVGHPIDANYRLTAVAARSATLSSMQADGRPITLELPASTSELQPRPAPWGGPRVVGPQGLTQGIAPPAAALPGGAQDPVAAPAPGAEDMSKD